MTRKERKEFKLIKKIILKEANQTIKHLEEIREHVSKESSYPSGIINLTLGEMENLNELLNLRIQIVKKLDYDLGCVGKYFKNKHSIETILNNIDDLSSDEEKKNFIDALAECEHDEFSDYDEDRALDITKYFLMKADCIYQDVIQFIDEHYHQVCSYATDVESINLIVKEFTEEKIARDEAHKKALKGIVDDDYDFGFFYDKTSKGRLLKSNPVLTEEDFGPKNYETMIKLVNGVFLSRYIPLMETENYTKEEASVKIKKMFYNNLTDEDKE